MVYLINHTHVYVVGTVVFKHGEKSMKCIRNENTISRVSVEKAQELVSTGKWSYTTKSVWRRAVRGKDNLILN